ncbi:MAG: 16S rRNA (guanine(966)-N(2))-methyltransferase RsmD [Syntrophaceae bacterium]|nr:16S rRNA (guanine(966)-N(2))-methyltransferase RsmD [Syntrophaceae bacterium]
MRIIGGEAKGRKLFFPSGLKERPTSDFIRETLFNVLGPLQYRTFIDLFAGSGSVGLEAASRGAQEVCFVEKNIKLAEIAKKNISACCYDKICFIVAKDVEHALRDIYKKKRRFDIVFADPPYNKNLVKATLNILNKYQVVKKEGTIVIQHSIKENIPDIRLENVHLIDHRKYGENVLTFFKWRKDNGR